MEFITTLPSKIFKAVRGIKKKFTVGVDRPLEWHSLRSTTPVSKVFGLDRGTPIDRYYIEKFLDRHRSVITGRVMEIAESTYSKRFATPPVDFEVLHVDPSNKRATVVGDLTKPEKLPEGIVDCFICTQTLNFIFDVRAAVKGIYRLLKPGGTALVTVAGISQISRYDMDRWGDYWRLTTKSAQRLFAEEFGEANVSVQHFGNVLSSVSFLEGISMEELTPQELDATDDDYQMIITIAARKNI